MPLSNHREPHGRDTSVIMLSAMFKAWVICTIRLHRNQPYEQVVITRSPTPGAP